MELDTAYSASHLHPVGALAKLATARLGGKIGPDPISQRRISALDRCSSVVHKHCWPPPPYRPHSGLAMCADSRMRRDGSSLSLRASATACQKFIDIKAGLGASIQLVQTGTCQRPCLSSSLGRLQIVGTIINRAGGVVKSVTQAGLNMWRPRQGQEARKEGAHNLREPGDELKAMANWSRLQGACVPADRMILAWHHLFPFERVSRHDRLQSLICSLGSHSYPSLRRGRSSPKTRVEPS